MITKNSLCCKPIHKKLHKLFRNKYYCTIKYTAQFQIRKMVGMMASWSTRVEIRHTMIN